MTSIFSNNTLELKHKRVSYTIPEYIFIKTDPLTIYNNNNSSNNNEDNEFRGTFGLYTACPKTFLDGAYSIVVKYEDMTVKNKDNSRIALKISSNTKKYIKKNNQEIIIYELLRKKTNYSKFICTCYGTETLKYGRKYFNYLTMEYLTCDLFDYIFKHKKQYTHTNIYKILFQSLKALEFLHNNNIIYNDLKMENIMISRIKYNKNTTTTDIYIKLIDFNCSTLLTGNVEVGGGTLEYMSPELQRCVNKKKFKSLTPKSDVWSVGILTCLLFLHSQPYEDKNCHKTIENVQKNIYDNIDECIKYVHNIKHMDGIPVFINNPTNEKYVITSMDMCFKSNISDRASIEDLLFILDGCKSA